MWPDILEWITPRCPAFCFLKGLIWITDRLDVTVLTAFGGFIDKCWDQKTLQNVLQYLGPIQMGEVSPKEVPTVSMDTMKLYHDTMEMVRSEMRMEM